MRFPTKFPTLIGLLFFLLLIGGVIIVFERFVRLPSAAVPSVAPKNVEFTNISDTGFTMSWVTSEPATGAVIIGRDREKAVVFFDERDSAGKLGQYITHSVTYRLAKPQSDYSAKILSNGKTFTDGDSPYRIRTGSTIASSSNNLEPAYGTVTTEEGKPALGSIVYLTLEGSQKLSTLVTSTGSWLIPLNLLRSLDLSQYITGEGRLTESIVVRNGLEESQAVTDTLNDSPVPEMRLNKTYDFREQQAKNLKQEAPLAQNTPGVLGETSSISVDHKVTITKPIEGAALPTALPLFQGTGVPGRNVSVVLGIIHPVAGTTTVGSDGIWRFTPAKPLSPGKSSVTITSVDRSGSVIALTRTFEILKEGTQVLGTATPSATLTPTISASPSSTLAGQPLPQSGNSLETIVLLLLGFGLLTSGLVVFVK